MLIPRRQLQVLTNIAEGLSNKAIARRMGLSPKTVEAHIARAFLSLEVNDRTHAVVKALRMGLLKLEDIPC